MSRDYSKSEFSKHRAALREFESICDKMEDLEQENDFLYSDRELVANERDAAVDEINRTVKEIRDLNSRTKYFGRFSKKSRSMYSIGNDVEVECEEKCVNRKNKIKEKISEWVFRGMYALVVVAVILLACGVTPEMGAFSELWIELICDPWRLVLVGVTLFGSYKILFRRK